jgi:UDP:flavonoid glycosyltransferase YjiC (YdhE family)
LRFLFTTHPLYGHFHAMAPVARALREHGHEVAVATGKRFGPVVERAGLTHLPCGVDLDGSNDVFEAAPERESLKTRFPGMEGVQQLHAFIEWLAPQMIEDLGVLINTWRPDLIIRDPTEYGGYVAAELAGLPHATVTWAVYISPHFWITDALLELCRRYGLSGDSSLQKMDSYLVLSFLPPSWPYPDSSVLHVTHRYRCQPFDLSGGDVLPAWVEELPDDRPTVHVTLGTTFNQSPETFQAVLDALSAEEANVIMTVGRTMDPAQFQPHPDHIHIAQYIPQSLLLPHCDAILFHGGYNSLHSALWHGLPMAIVPMGAGDQLPNAQICAGLGAAVLVEQQPPEPEAIREAVRTILEQPGYRAQAQKLQREIQELPDLSEAVRRLEALARTHEPQLNQD